MNFSEIAKTATLNHMADYLKATGRPVKGHFTCLSMQLGTPNAHPDSHPSMNYNRKNGTIHCHQCGLTLDLVELVKFDYKLGRQSEALNKVRELFPDVPKLSKKEEKKGAPLGWNDKIGKAGPSIIPINQLIETDQDARTKQQIEDDVFLFNVAYKSMAVNPEGAAQWSKRGISLDTINNFQLGYESNYPHFRRGNGENAYTGRNAAVITVPYLDNEHEAVGVLRNLDPQADHGNRHDFRGPRDTYNKSILKSEYNYVFVTEGEIDGLSIYECGYDSFVSLGGAENRNKFIQCLQDPSIDEKILILLLDNDEAGKRATDEIIQKLSNQSKYFCYVPEDFYPGGIYPDGIKDVNEYLVMFPDRLKEALGNLIGEARAAKAEAKTKELEDYLNETSVLGVIDSFKEDLGKPDTTPIYSTGFPVLDNFYLSGGLHGQSLIIIGALSSSGKTTFIQQIADNIAESGKDVMLFSLEMSTSELIAKTISRLTLVKALEQNIDVSNAKSVYGILDGANYANYSQTEIDLIYQATEYYKNRIAKNMYIFEGMGNVTVVPAGYEVPSIRERVDRHVNLTGRKPVVIVDYLQILAPYNEKSTDKQNTDKAVLELKRIARDYNLPVIAISSMNRDSYGGPITFSSFKESGAIEYSSDVLLGLEFFGQSEKIVNKNGKAVYKYVDIEEAKGKTPRQMELKLIKNRTGKMTGNLIKYEYHSTFNFFDEIGLFTPSNPEEVTKMEKSKEEKTDEIKKNLESVLHPADEIKEPEPGVEYDLMDLYKG